MNQTLILLFVDLINNGASGKNYQIGVGGNSAASVYANNLYFDLTWNRKTTAEDYFLFKTLSSKALVKLNSTSISTTIGFKF